MKFAAMFGLGVILGLAGVAGGHPAGDYYGKKWPTAGLTVVDAYFTNDSGWGPQKEDSARVGFNRWDQAGGASFKFNFPAGTHANHPGFERADCNPAPSNDIHWDGSIPNSSNALAVANGCDTDGDGKLDAFVAVFDSSVNWNVNEAEPADTEFDLRAAAAHESGHVNGFGLGSKEGAGQYQRMAPGPLRLRAGSRTTTTLQWVRRDVSSADTLRFRWAFEASHLRFPFRVRATEAVLEVEATPSN